MRIDRVLYRLRFCKSRSLAQRLVDAGHVRCNGIRVTRTSHAIAEGDVLTLPLGSIVRIVAVDALPARRGPAAEAHACYRDLDPASETAIAASKAAARKGRSPQ